MVSAFFFIEQKNEQGPKFSIYNQCYFLNYKENWCSTLESIYWKGPNESQEMAKQNVSPCYLLVLVHLHVTGIRACMHSDFIFQKKLSEFKSRKKINSKYTNVYNLANDKTSAPKITTYHIS